MMKLLHQHKRYCRLSEITLLSFIIQNTVVCYQEIPALNVKATAIMPILTGVIQAERRREMVPVSLIRIYNKCSGGGNNLPTQQVSVDARKDEHGQLIQYTVTVTYW
jgi:hypothetical protein